MATVMCQSNQESDVMIASFPVTNMEYVLFLNDAGHRAHYCRLMA